MKISIGDITKVNDIDVIVNAANGIGVCGRGVAGAIGQSGGQRLRDLARQEYLDHGKPFQPGEVYETDACLLKRRGVQKIYHAVVMEFPGGQTNVDVVAKALRTAVSKAIQNGMKTIVIPGLGTGIGGLDKSQVANRMARILQGFDGSIDISVIDIDAEFISLFEKSLTIIIPEKENIE